MDQPQVTPAQTTAAYNRITEIDVKLEGIHRTLRGIYAGVFFFTFLILVSMAWVAYQTVNAGETRDNAPSLIR